MTARRKSSTRNLGKAEGVAEARKTKGNRTFMHEQAEEDAKEAKQSASAKHIKECHGYARELEMRVRACRLATSTPDAIGHDLERVLELCVSVKEEAGKALEALAR